MFLDHFWGTCLPVEEVWICALCFFLWRVSFIFLWAGEIVREVNVRRCFAKGHMQVVVGGCGFLLARCRWYRERHRRRHDHGEGLILHLFEGLLVWVFVGLHSPRLLASCPVRKIVGRG